VSADAVELERVVSECGNLAVRPQQFWLGPDRAGRRVSLWIDTTTVHVSIDGVRIKTRPSRYSTVDLARLRRDGAHPAGPPPAPPSPSVLAAGAAVELDRTVTAIGMVALGGRLQLVGSPLAGQRVTFRLEEHLGHVVVDGALWHTLASPIEPGARPSVPLPGRRRSSGIGSSPSPAAAGASTGRWRPRPARWPG
jgi:hypothetical protein